MRLFIASTFADSVKQFYERQHGGKVLFCSNPADPFKTKYWVKKDYKAFVDYGFDVTSIDLRTIDANDLREKLNRYQIFFISGGSAVYIIDLLHKKKMDSVIVDAIRDGLLYTGTSAGSMIMAPDISLCADDEDEQEAKQVGKVKNLKGLGLIPFYLMCHCQEKYYVPSTKRAINRLPKNKLPILFLNDGMAVWVHNSHMEIVGK
jgi:dipeptidase E